jgi:hypothetical protein
MTSWLQDFTLPGSVTTKWFYLNNHGCNPWLPHPGPSGAGKTAKLQNCKTAKLTTFQITNGYFYVPNPKLSAWEKTI